jgi:hypothetical protein
MKAKLSHFLCPTGVLTSALLILAGVTARAADKPTSDDFPNFDSYIKISGQAASISGNEAAFQSRTTQPNNGGAGIEDLHFAKDVSKTTSIVIDGRALTGAEDYLGRFNVSKTDVGSVDVGYKRFRTFYDGAGGFFPLNNQWDALTNQDLSIDRSKFWVEANLTLPNAPVLTLRYTNELRSGDKDSTIWGDTDFTGLPNNRPPISQVRKIVPSWINVDERHELFEASVRHTIKTVSFQFTLLNDRTDNTDTRYVTRFPGEAKPFPSPAATILQPAAKMNNQIILAQVDGLKTQTSGFNTEASAALTDKLTLRAGASYELVHSTIGGDRPLITSTPTATGVVPVTTDNYQNLTGGSRIKDYKGNVALDFQPIPTLFLKVGLRAQDEFIRGNSSYTVIAASGTPAVTLTSTPRVDWAKLHQNVQTPVAEVRFTGIKDVALYFTGSKRTLNGDERNTSSYNPLTVLSGTLANNNVSEDHGDYKLGASWKAASMLTLRAEVFRKGHKDNSVGFGPSNGDYYLLDTQYTGYKFTALAKPFAQLGFTTRFISQHGTAQVTGYLPTYPAYDSLNTHNYMIGETVDWTPSSQVYVQLNANATFQVISTIYPRAGITPAAGTSIAFDTGRVLQNSNNNYMTGSVLAGFVVDKKTDLQIQGNYYKADNGNAFLAPLTQPYGVAVRDLSVTLGMKRKLSDRLICNAKIGYFDSVNDTTGGFTNYHGPIAYLAFDHAF